MVARARMCGRWFGGGGVEKMSAALAVKQMLQSDDAGKTGMKEKEKCDPIDILA